MTHVHVKVIPNSPKFRIELIARQHPKIYLRSKPIRGIANRELIRKLTQILEKKVMILSGHNSRRKVLAVDMPYEEVIDRLRSCSGC